MPDYGGASGFGGQSGTGDYGGSDADATTGGVNNSNYGGYEDEAPTVDQPATSGFGVYGAQESFDNAMGITDDNPYGRQGFFSRVFGIDPKNISYSGIMSPGTRRAIRNNQFSKFANPQNIKGMVGYNENFDTAPPGQLRSGVQKAGYNTMFGPVMSQFAEQTPMDMAVRGTMGLFGGPVGLALSQIGTKEYGLPGQPGFESFDPNNPRGPQSMLGKIASTLTGGIDPRQATAQAAAGIQSLRDRFAPSTPMPGVMPTSPPSRPARNPDMLAGFEQRFNRPSMNTGVTRPEVSMTRTRGPGIESYFDESTPQNPVPGFSINDPSTGFKEDLMDAYLDSRERQTTPTVVGFSDVNRRQVGVLDDLGMAARQLGENIVAVPGGYMNTETGRTYSGQYNPNARARTFTGTQQPQGTAPFSFGSFIQNIVGQ